MPWAQSATAKTPITLPDAQQIFRPFMAGAKNGDLDSFDPALIFYNSDYNLAQLVFPPLVTLDDHNQVAPWAAERWETSANGLTWTFHMHPGMRWSDGVPIDAGTYAYSINRSLDPCTRSPVGYYLWGTGAELITGSVAFNGGTCPTGATTSTDTLVGKSILVPDPQTLVLRLSHPAAYFPTALTYSAAWAQPKQLIERYGATMNSFHESIFQWTEHLADGGGFGGNLFAVKRWDHAGPVTLVRNDSFWGQKPKLKEVDVTLHRDFTDAWDDYTHGQGDYAVPVLNDNAGYPSPANIAAARAMPGFHEGLDLAILYLIPNWALAPFNDVRVRQAFDLALDRRATGQLLTYAIMPSIHMVPEGMPGYNPSLHDPDGRVGEAALSPDVARARALWQAYLADKFGGDASKAPPVTLVYRPRGRTVAEVMSAVQGQWQAAMPGLQISLSEIDSDARPAKYLQLILSGWAMDYPDPQDVLLLLGHTGSPYNQSGISLPAADTLLDQADANLNQAERLAQYQQAEQLLVDAVAWIPIGQSMNAYIVRPRVAGGYHERASEQTAIAVWQRLSIVKG